MHFVYVINEAVSAELSIDRIFKTQNQPIAYEESGNSIVICAYQRSCFASSGISTRMGDRSRVYRLGI